VWTKFEEGRSRHSRVIEQKRFWQIWPWWPWPLIKWPQNRQGLSATQDGCVDQVWRR